MWQHCRIQFKHIRKMANDVLEIDGSFLEGGGQILRNALSFSCITQRPVRITCIRANRPNPGLSNQHLYGLNLLQQIAGARVKGNYIKSTEVEFHPGKIKAGNYFVDTQTAASVTLVLQAVLPVLLFGGGESSVEMVGGTNVGMSPQIDYTTEVFRPNLELFGATFDFDLLQRGYFPRGGGRCKVTIPAVSSLQAVDITNFGTLIEVTGWCFVAGRIPVSVAETTRSAVEKQLTSLHPQEPISIQSYKESVGMAKDNASGVILKATTSEGCTLGSAALGAKKENDLQLGFQAATELEKYVKNGICVERHIQDQLIIFMALAEGVTRVRTCALTDHTRTAMHVAELMANVKFLVEELDSNVVIVTCKGIGKRNINF